MSLSVKMSYLILFVYGRFLIFLALIFSFLTLAMEEIAEPTIDAVQDETFDPTNMTWFIIALIVAITMMVVICFSIWAYNHR